MREAVVLVHGIWMTGLDLVPLRHRLRQDGYDARIFRYRSLARTPAAHAADLAAFVNGRDADVVHLVGHSLGGVVILHCFDAFPVARAGRVVLLGCPVQGSAVARVLAARALTRPLLGRSGEAWIVGDTPDWKREGELGTIAGDRAVGVGRVLGGLDGPSDGTVGVAETDLPGARDRVVLPVTHTGLVLSAAVYRHCLRFLRTGRFRTAVRDSETRPANRPPGPFRCE